MRSSLLLTSDPIWTSFVTMSPPKLLSTLKISLFRVPLIRRCCGFQSESYVISNNCVSSSRGAVIWVVARNIQRLSSYTNVDVANPEGTARTNTRKVDSPVVGTGGVCAQTLTESALLKQRRQAERRACCRRNFTQVSISFACCGETNRLFQ